MTVGAEAVGYSDEEQSLREMVRDFVQREAKAASVEYEDKGIDPADFYSQLGRLGLTGIPFDPEYGGGGQQYRTYLMVVEELARGWVALAIGLGVHTLCCDGIQRFGSSELKQRLLPSMLSGESFGAYALSEPASGSDAASLRTKATRTNEHYELNGQKQFCTRGGEADRVLMMTRTGGEGPGGITAFVVEKGTEGFRPSKTENKMGWRSSPTWEIQLDGCKVPAANRLGEEGEGFTIALSALDAGRLGIAACSIGVAQAALDSAIDFATNREQFGTRISDFQGIQFMLADMATEIEAGRALYRRAAELKDAGARYSKEAAMAKLFCSDIAMKIATDAVQIHGGYGYIEEYPVERYMREAKALQIVEGTNQIQRMIIGATDNESVSQPSVIAARRIVCLDQPGTEGDWMTIQNGKVLEVGSENPPSEPQTLDGYVFPGFIDAHVHLTTTGLYAGGLDFRECRSVDDLIVTLESFSKRTNDRWIIGGNFDPGRNRQEAMPTAAEIDRVTDGKAVLISRADGHSCSLNSEGFALVGLEPGSLGIDVDAHGIPTGVVRDQANYEARRRFFSMIPEEQLREAQMAGCRLALEKGCTSVHEMAGGSYMGNKDFRVLMASRDEFPIHVVPYLATLDLGEVIEAGLHCVGGDLFLDGSIGSRTAAMSQPYEDADGSGHLYHSDEEITNFFLEATRAGIQAGVHAIGDAAIEQAIRCIEEAFASLEPEGGVAGIRLRHRIEHFECTNEDQLNRAARAGLTPSVQPMFDGYWGGDTGMYGQRLGARAKSMNPFSKMLARGLFPAGGSDSTVTPLDPILGIQSAVLHRNEDFRIGVEQALRMFTIWGARAAHEEAERGSLEPGKWADFTVLTEDPRLVPPEELTRIGVRETWVAGRRLF